MTVGIILAAGRGNRFGKKNINKTSVDFLGKPLVCYGTELLLKTCDKVVVVVGNHSQDVINAVGKDPKIVFAYQKKRLGTGHAVKVAVREIKKRGWSVQTVFVGMGDHMMYYQPKIIKRLSEKINKKDAVTVIVTCEYDNPDSLAWGRIIREKSGEVASIVEQKDANKKQSKIKELNAGFYCFHFDFLSCYLNKIEKSPVSGEYYLTDLIKIAFDNNKKVVALKVPFKYVGIGINTQEELEKSKNLFKKVSTVG